MKFKICLLYNEISENILFIRALKNKKKMDTKTYKIITFLKLIIFLFGLI